MAGKPQRQRSTNVSMPAPYKGLEANAPIFDSVEGMEKAVSMINIVPRELGCKVREGSREYATELVGEDDMPGDVRTIIPFEAHDGSLRLFAATDKGIFDITSSGTGPWTPVLEWAIQGNDAGWCSFTNFTNVGGNHYLLLCDERNGYHIYNGETDTWEEGSITGGDPDATTLVYVMEWQNRIWFVQRDSATVWYLPIGAIEGNPTPIELGSRYSKGGYTVQLASWTLDDGAGLDDKLIAMSSAGDVVVFSGIDPDNASEFIMEGRWYIGRPPKGRRVMANFGGDVIMLSVFGILSASRLLAGEKIQDDAYLTDKIARYFRLDMLRLKDFYGWEIKTYPAYGVALVATPPEEGKRRRQYCLTINTKAWTTWADLDMLCMNDTSAGFFFGTRDGRVLRMEGVSDYAPVDPETGGAARSIKFSFLTHYDGLGQPGNWKRVHFIRPSFVGGAPPIYTVLPDYDFALDQSASIPPATEPEIALWDSALWDVDRWAGTVQSYIQTRGGGGMGRQIALFMTGETATDMSLIGFDLIVDGGGIL